MITLKWKQVNAWRLSQHCLSDRLQPEDLVRAVRQTMGVQAQVMSAAELAIAARVDRLSSQDIQSALWKDRTLVKTWAMRAALHLIPASDLPLYVAARSLSETRNWPYFFSYYGVSQAILDEYLAIGPEILTAVPLTRVEFANAVAERIKSPELRRLLLATGWGTALKPLAWRGELCFGPNQGQNVTYVRPSSWIGGWRSIEPFPAIQEVVRRYLQTFGPATLEDFTLWWSARKIPTKKVFESLEDELELVDVDGWQAYILCGTMQKMEAVNPAGVVNLLPLFDAYLMGIGRGEEIEPLIAREYQEQVFRPQGWISAVVLVDGMIKGTWEYKVQRLKTRVTVSLFSKTGNAMKHAIASETERLSKFLNTTIQLVFTEY